LPDQPQQSKTFVKDVTLHNEVSGWHEGEERRGEERRGEGV
jgi:hypothetical protein